MCKFMIKIDPRLKILLLVVITYFVSRWVDFTNGQSIVLSVFMLIMSVEFSIIYKIINKFINK